MAHLADGVYSFGELANLGVGNRALARLIGSGEVRRVFRGLYVVGDAPPDEQMVRARVFATRLPLHHVICDRSAAWIHGVDVFGARALESVPALETCVFRGRSRTDRVGADGRTRDLSLDDIQIVGAVRVTTPLRTALDLGCALPRTRALGAMDQLARLHHLSPLSLAREVPRFRGRRGVVQLRALASLVDGRSESMRESWMRLTIVDAGLPAPEVQWEIRIDGRVLWRLDLAYPKSRIAIEYDGEEYHRRTREQCAADAARRRWLRENGWTVIVVDRQGYESDPERTWLAEIREALRSRTPRFRWEAGR